MASLLKNRDCQYWVACFRDATGKQCRRTTRETNRKKAQAIANQYQAIAQGKVTQRGAREIMAELYRKQFGAEVPTTTVESYVDAWLKMKAPELSGTTLKNYQFALTTFLEFLGESAKADIVSVTRRHLVEFRNFLSEFNSPRTVNTRLLAVKTLFHNAKRDGYLIDDPGEFVESVRVSEKDNRREAFTIAEIKSLLSVADPEWRSMILFGLYTGQRLGDICLLSWDHVDLERDEIRFISKKMQKSMLIPIAPPLRVHIESMPSSDVPGAPLHPKAFRQYPDPKQTSLVNKGFAGLLMKAGLREYKASYKYTGTGGKGKIRGRAKTHRLSFHCLRHTAVSLLKDAGVPQAAVMEFIGHSSIDISQHYTHVGLESLRNAAGKFPSL
jgi:integrase